MADNHITKRKLKTAANRQYILHVSQQLFAQYGYEKTSMKEISAATKLPIGSLYYHFKNKEDILLQICTDVAKTPMPALTQETLEKARSPYQPLFHEIDHYGDIWATAGAAVAYNVYATFEHIYDVEGNYHSVPFYNNMLNFITIAQNLGTFDQTFSPEEATDYLFMITRTLIYEWALARFHDHQVWLCGKYVPRILKTFIL